MYNNTSKEEKQSVLLPNLVGNKATSPGGMQTPGAPSYQSSAKKAPH